LKEHAASEARVLVTTRLVNTQRIEAMILGREL
jgi:hypothetical protein